MEKSVKAFNILSYIALLLVVGILFGCGSDGDADILIESQTGSTEDEQPAPDAAAAKATTPVTEQKPEEKSSEAGQPSAVKITGSEQKAATETKTGATTEVKTTVKTEARQRLEEVQKVETTSKATAPEDVVGFATLSLRSTPSGAKIDIDGKERSITGMFYGLTTKTILNVPAGKRVIKLAKAGYIDYEYEVYLPPGRIIEHHAVLVKK